MELDNPRIERFLKSTTLSVILFLLWGTLTALRARTLWDRFSTTEVVWIIYNASISILFLMRTRPTVVSMNPVHWLVALTTAFSGLLFARYIQDRSGWHILAGAIPIYGGMIITALATLTLGRSYDLFPALRRIKTRKLYRWVRHPMYGASILIRAGYLIRNPSLYNAALMALVTWLYMKRARYEEELLLADPVYRDYVEDVPRRFLPWPRRRTVPAAPVDFQAPTAKAIQVARVELADAANPSDSGG